MAHMQQFRFVESVKNKFPEYFSNKKVLEVGSLDINGSIRKYFTDCDYTGVDLGPGKAVDIVAKGEELDFADSTFDVAVSCECFEHNEHWKETFLNMIRMTNSEGLVFFSCATTGRKEHGTRRTNPTSSPFTGDYYRNLTEEDFQSLELDRYFTEYYFSVDHSHHDLFFYGIKR
jgi:ubiquinone/menaquinone biosynthesis C-methylase UbiE